MTPEKQKTFIHEKKNGGPEKKTLKKMVAKMENQSLTEGSWKEKARISPRTWSKKRQMENMRETNKKVQEVQHQNNGSSGLPWWRSG